MIDWQLHYDTMEANIERCMHLPLGEPGQVEEAFKVALAAWMDFKNQLTGYRFTSEAEEIDFYKNIKPQFTRHIEYFPMVYLSLSYRPLTREVSLLSDFWNHETKKLQKFIDKNLEFVKYYRGGCTNMDRQYFLGENYDLANYIVSKVYETDGEYLSSHDHLVATLLAHEMYHAYAKERSVG